MEDKLVTHNGVEVAEGWPAHIDAAQKQMTFKINGKPYKRIPYGSESEDWGADRLPCMTAALLKVNSTLKAAMWSDARVAADRRYRVSAAEPLAIGKYGCTRI